LVDPTLVLILLVAGGLGGYFLWYIFGVIRKKALTGAESLIGKKGIVYTEMLSSKGEVTIDGVIWRAYLVTPGDPLKKGEEVIVKKVEDITLIVERAPR
jgi:membrane protein implicated in regulation of membrane protease activity